MKTETKADLLPQPTSTPVQQLKLADVLQMIRQKIKTVHVVAVIGAFSILLGYLSIAPPTDLPNWPLYSLNTRTWQFFERWVKEYFSPKKINLAMPFAIDFQLPSHHLYAFCIKINLISIFY